MKTAAQILSALAVLLLAPSAFAQSMDLPLGHTVTVDLGAPIRSLEIEGRDRIEVRAISPRAVAVTALRGGPAKLHVRTADGMQRVELTVRSPQKQELSSRELERFLEDHAPLAQPTLTVVRLER